MSWLKLPIHFGSRMATILVDAREIVGQSISQQIGAEPDGMEAFLKILILHHRPDLAGLVVEALDMDYPRCAWKVICSHPSFPVGHSGMTIPEMPVTFTAPTEIQSHG